MLEQQKITRSKFSAFKINFHNTLIFHFILTFRKTPEFTAHILAISFMDVYYDL